ncbi:M28 family peptidase [Marinobacter sp.]|uniref:M28 family peptidase n=1 Tax=Marinobacter sp. TaxID=50741 RepID=UPI0038509971
MTENRRDARSRSENKQRLAETLEADVRTLAVDIGERNMLREGALEDAAEWIEKRFEKVGLTPIRVPYELSLPGLKGRKAWNLVAEVTGEESSAGIVVIGAHYDSVPGSPGANDNASSVAALLALAEWFGPRPQKRTLRFVAFTNEEPPFYFTPSMGSHAYARQCREKNESIRAMISMDGIGYYSDEPDSQHYPVSALKWLYPDRADFIGFVTRPRDFLLMRKALKAFRKADTLLARGVALPPRVPGVAWSDHWSFWESGYPALMVTDTLLFRDPLYHRPGDNPERLDYHRMAQVVVGLRAVLKRLAE